MLFFIYGTDHYRCQEKLKALTDEFVKKRDRSGGFNVVKLADEDLGFDRFRQEALSAPFLGEKKMIIVKNALQKKEFWEPIFEFLKSRGENLDNNLIFVELLADEKKTRPAGALFDYLKKQKYCWEFNRLNHLQLKNWLQNYLAGKDAPAENEAIEELSLVVGNDLSQMVLETDKLIAYRNGAKIKAADVRELVKAKYDENIFGLVDALGQKNKKMALRLLADQLNSGNHPLQILPLIFRQFKILIQLKDGGTGAGLHPFVRQKASLQAKNFTLPKLTRLYGELIQIERQLKSGAPNPELLFDLFIAKNC